MVAPKVWTIRMLHPFTSSLHPAEMDIAVEISEYQCRLRWHDQMHEKSVEHYQLGKQKANVPSLRAQSLGHRAKSAYHVKTQDRDEQTQERLSYNE